MPSDDYTYIDFLNDLRFVLHKRPMPQEPEPGIGDISLDGVRRMSMREWSIALGISKQAVSQRWVMVRRRIAAGDRNPYRAQPTATYAP